MARFKIYSKDGQSVRYEGKPKYLGVYLNPSCLKFSEISSSEPIAWEVGDYVDYPRTGMRYRLYSIPQPSKEARSGSYGGAFRYSGVELYAATKELEIALFRDLVGNDNNIHFSTSPDVATFEDVYGIARRIQACMDDLYPGRWEIRVADFDADADAEILEKISTAKDFAMSGGTCLDALSKIYELWQDTGWIHSFENGKEVITIGYTNKRIDSNISDSYLYGKGNGLTAIKKTQTNGEEFATRLYVYGSERNLPSRYYNGLDILNAESVDIRNLMLPPDTWGQTDGLPDARKAYLENAEAVAKFGVIPKTHYFDSEDAGADIYPTIERLTIGEIRDAMSPDDDYYPSESYSDTDRADAVLSAENPSDDGVINPNGKEYDAKAYLSIQSLDKTVNMVGGLRESPLLTDYPLFSKTIETDFSRGKVVVDLSQTIAIPDKGFSSVVARVTIGDDEQAGYGTTVGSNTFPAVKSEDGKNWEIKLGRISAEYGKSELYDNTEYNVYGHVSITANTVGVESSEITIVFRPGSGSIGIKRILDKTFRLNLKQIGFDINEQASLGKGKTISMKTGACAGRNFVISDCFYSSAYDSWVLTCKRQQDDTLGMLFPNNAYEIAEGDIFVLVDIAMPSLYISVAMNRLLSEGQKFLARASKIQSHYEPSIDAKVMAESGRTLREGMFMEITDEDVVDNTTDYILIDTLSIAEDESTIPTYKVTLRERRKVTYKGTPSATSATETKSVEDETEVQPNVDLTGYAKETYVNDKVSEVNNLLASMWSLDDDGNLVTDRNVIIKNNLIVTKDTSTGGTGTDQGVSGTVTGIRVDADTILEPTNGIVDMSDVLANLEVDVDLSDYYTKQETLAEIASAIAEINIPSLDGYATEAYVTDAITALNLGQYATTASLTTLQTEVDNIEAILGMDEEAAGIINTWNEVKAFLGSIEVDDDLASILERMNADIATRALDSDLDTLAGRVGVNELAIADNAGNIKKNFDAIGTLESNKADWGTTLAHYGITDAYTKTEVAAELAKYILKEAESQTIKGDLIIEGNLVVTKDTSSGGTGSDAGVAGTLLGITVNGTTYNEPVNGILALPDYPTTLPASDVYAWAKASTKPSYTKSEVGLGNVENKSSATIRGEITSANVTNALGYTPLSTAGGTISGTAYQPFNVESSYDGFVRIGLYNKGSQTGFLGWSTNEGIHLYENTNGNYLGILADGTAWCGKSSAKNTLLHSGNYSNYALPLSGGKTITGKVLIQTAGWGEQFGIINTTQGSDVVMRFYSQDTSHFTGGFGFKVQDSSPIVNIAGVGDRYLIHSGNSTSYNAGGLAHSNGTVGATVDANGKILLNEIDLLGTDGSSVIAYFSKASASDNTIRLFGKEANSLVFGTNNTARMLINSSGNVTVGSTDRASTTRKLFVEGNTTIEGLLTMDGNVYFYGGNKDCYLDNKTYDGLAVCTNSSVRMVIGANVLIGTIVDNGAKLQVEGKIYAETGLLFNGDYGIWKANKFTTTAGDTAILYNATRHVLVGGNVLIGTTADSGHMLNVAGTFNSNALRTDSSTKAFWGHADYYGILSWDTTYASVMAKSGLALRLGISATPYITIASNGAISMAGAVTMSRTLSVTTSVTSTRFLTNGEYGFWKGSHFSSVLTADDVLMYGNSVCMMGTTRPFSNKTTTLGTASYQWSAVYAVNAIFSGDTATGSDIRFKDRIADHRIALESIAQAPLFTFKWNDREDKTEHLGTSAQYWEGVAPWLVKGTDFKVLDYSTLGVAIGISLANKTLNHEERIKILERENEQLKEQIRRIQYGS